MSKRGFISRYLLLIKKLKVKPYSSFEELEQYIIDQHDFLQLQDDDLIIGFSKRTLQRDLKEIRNLFGVDIEYSKSMKGYFISQDDAENMNFQRMLESYEMISALQKAKKINQYIQFEKNSLQGVEHLKEIINAIKNTNNLQFTYSKYWENEASYRTAEPYLLKEFKSRWYVLCLDKKDLKIKTFALDRMSNVANTKTLFSLPTNFNFEEYFTNSFGIFCPDDVEVETVELQFTTIQGRYVKSLPLHKSQTIIADNDNHLIIQLNMFVTHDFIMELLSFGNDVKVNKPESLKNELINRYSNALKQY
jgi:predicted DNA-binding transcriptional regulator YafY